ncbi:MAG TPA: phosphoadenylyl-sulfate reductase, partial [Pirellulales bacterium]
FLAEVNPKVHVFNLDTGYQFPETLQLRDDIAARYGIEVELVRAATTTAEYEAPHALPLYQTNPNQCCKDRKIDVLKKAAVGWDAWMTAIRRDQSSDRANAPIVGWDYKFNLVKISPLANWTNADVWRLIRRERVPYNPLYDDGYTSIGCQPCTWRVPRDDDESSAVLAR